jgi:hypothetical protein
MDFKLLIGLTPEFANLLQAFITSFGNVPAGPAKLNGSPAKPMTAVPETPKVNAPAPAAAPADGKRESPSDDGAVQITIEALRALVAEKGKAGHQATVKSLLDEFGAKNLSTLPDDKRTAFYNKVKAIA